jgi:hypothetical protein
LRCDLTQTRTGCARNGAILNVRTHSERARSEETIRRLKEQGNWIQRDMAGLDHARFLKWTEAFWTEEQNLPIPFYKKNRDLYVGAEDARMGRNSRRWTI